MSHPAYLLHGDDELAISSKAKEIVSGIVPSDRQAFGLEVVAIQSDTVDAVAETLGRGIMALKTVGFFAGEKVVWIRDFALPRSTARSLSEAIKARLDELTKIVEGGLPAGVRLVISALEPVTYSPLLKAFEKVGVLHLFEVPEKRRDWRQVVHQKLSTWLAENSIQMDEEARMLFTMRVGGDSRAVASELEKLAAYAIGLKTLSPADVTSVVSASGDSEVWDLADAIAKRSLPEAMEAVRRLLTQKDSSIGMIVVLQGRIRELLVLREAIERKWLMPNGVWGRMPPGAEQVYGSAMQRDPRKTSPYFQRQRIAQASQFSRAQLLRCQELLANAHRELLAGSLPDALVMETLVVKMLA